MSRLVRSGMEFYPTPSLRHWSILKPIVAVHLDCLRTHQRYGRVAHDVLLYNLQLLIGRRRYQLRIFSKLWPDFKKPAAVGLILIHVIKE